MPQQHSGWTPVTAADTSGWTPVQPNAQHAQNTKTWLQTAEDFLPAVGGTIGAIAGGVPGSVLGGMAGQGYKELAQHITELPGALRDIAVNTAHGYGDAVAQGAFQGAQQGAVNAGTQGAIQGATTAVGQGISAAAGRLAPAVMQSALKPGVRSTARALVKGDVAPAVQTLLKEGVNVTNGGIAKLSAIIDSTNEQISDRLAQLPQKAMSISAEDVASRLGGTAAKFSQQVNPASDVAAVTKAGQEFVAAHGPYLTLPEAQGVKAGTYQALGSKAYGELSSAQIEAQKALARGLKEEIESDAARGGMSDVSALNAKEGAAITARDAVAARVAQVANRDPTGLAWLAHNPTTFVFALAQRNPAVKSLIARGLYAAAGQAAGVPAEAIRYAVGAIAASADQPKEPQ